MPVLREDLFNLLNPNHGKFDLDMFQENSLC